MKFLQDLSAVVALDHKSPLQRRLPGEHHLCILSMRALVKHDYCFRKITNEEGLLGRIALSIQNDNPRTRLITVQIIARAAADKDGGSIAALDAMQYFSSVIKERTRYSLSRTLSTVPTISTCWCICKSILSAPV